MKKSDYLKLYKTSYTSPLGKLTLISDGNYLTNLILPTQSFNTANIEENDNLEVFFVIKNWLNKYFKKEYVDNSYLPIKYDGSNFQKLVWNYLCKTPYGILTTYKDVAKYISKLTNKKPCPQAVGNALNKNPIPIIIPCHRVVGTNKNLIGYNGRLDIKIKLLKIEGINVSEYETSGNMSR